MLGADLVMLAAFLLLDDLAEGDGALHRLGVKAEVLIEPLFAEGLPAADDAGGVIDLELVVLILEQVCSRALTWASSMVRTITL